MQITHTFQVSVLGLLLKQNTYFEGIKVTSISVRLPEYAPAVCAPAALTGALAPGTHHTMQCFFGSGSRG